MWRLVFSCFLAVATCGKTNHPILAIGSPAPLAYLGDEIRRLPGAARSASHSIIPAYARTTSTSTTATGKVPCGKEFVFDGNPSRSGKYCSLECSHRRSS